MSEFFLAPFNRSYREKHDIYNCRLRANEEKALICLASFWFDDSTLILSVWVIENGPTNAYDHDVLMVDDYANTVKALNQSHGFSHIKGISKQSYVKQPSGLKTSSIKYTNFHESVIYLLAPLKIQPCKDAKMQLWCLVLLERLLESNTIEEFM
ncbi:hypothetical protein R6Q59_027054 [Mikania micrantha]